NVAGTGRIGSVTVISPKPSPVWRAGSSERKAASSTALCQLSRKNCFKQSRLDSSSRRRPKYPRKCSAACELFAKSRHTQRQKGVSGLPPPKQTFSDPWTYANGTKIAECYQ